MKRYYVEFKDTTQTNGTAYLYVKAYNEEQIRDMFDEYDIVAIDITEQEKIMWHRITDFFNVDYHKNYGEGTKFDLDYGKLLIIGLCIYIAVMVS